MPNYTVGSTRVVLEQSDLTAPLANGSVVLDSRRVRPYWFDGRFLDARDLEREQNYFLIREADLGQAGGFETLSGLMVDQTNAAGQSVGSGAIVIHAGQGVTPAGELVSATNDLTLSLASLNEQTTLDAQFGLSTAPAVPPQKRTGLYVIALQPVEQTSKPISAYPTTVQGPRTTHDSNIVESTVISLVPYPNPAGDFTPSQLQAALARQIFVSGNPSTLPDSLLPLAVISVQQGSINWIDPYLVRRDTGPQYNGVRFGLTDPATQRAYLLQYDTQLQSIVASRQAAGLKANITASDFLQSIPSAGRFPIDAINTNSFSQVFFPQEMDVRLSVIPEDELPALLQDGMSLPSIDLTLASSSYSSMAVFALIPVDRSTFASLKNSLPDTPLNPILPQVLANRSPLQLLQLFQGSLTLTPVPAVSNNAWATAIGTQQYAYYVRRPSDPTLVKFTAPTGVILSSSVNPSALGQTVIFTAGLSPVSATGTVQFLDGKTIVATETVGAGIASLSIATLAVGAHPMTAVYAGDANNDPGTSSVLTQTVNKAATSVALSSSANPSTLGQAVTLTAAVSPNTATGTVQFSDGTTVLGSGTISAGVATFASSTLTLGAHSITAAYSGDANDNPSTSAVLTQTVNKLVSSVTLSSSANPSDVGQSVTFTATVTPNTATGAVQFLDGTAVLGNGVLAAGAATIAVSTLAAGTHSITAAYAGDADDAASTSTVLTQTVNKDASTVVVSSSDNPSTLGQTVTFTAKVTPATATGSVQFLDGTTALGTTTLSAGATTLPVSTLAVGSHSITAAYSGDPSDAASTSAAVTQVVNKANSTIALGSSQNPSTLGQSVTFTATSSPASGTGTVQFLDGTAPLGTSTVSEGVATLADASLAVGTHNLTGLYSGDGNNASSTSPVLMQTVNKAGSSVAVASAANPSTFGQSITFTATLTPATATGTVQFLDGTTSLGTEGLTAGAAALADASLSLGSHPITAAYSGDGNNAASTSSVVEQVVNKANSSVTLAASANPSTFGQSVTFTATVAPATATGAVQFLDGTVPLGTGTFAGGTATLPDASLAVGSHTITAAYAGDGNDAAATSAPLVQTVNPIATSVAVTSSADPSTLGQSVTFTAKVTPATATGTVTFLDGTTSLGTGTLSEGAAMFTTTSLAAGAHPITADYAGDGDNAASTSTPVSQTVNKIATSVALASSVNPSSPGQSVTFTATLTPATATGTVNFLDGATPLGSGALNAGTATMATATLAVRAHAITAQYGGDASNAASTSQPLTQTVNKIATATVLTSSVNPSTPGQSVTFTATVTPATATGTVAFLDGTASLGTGTLNAGTATFASTTLAAGTHSITAQYAGDANNAASNSPALAQAVNKLNVKMTLSSSANPSTQGQSVTFTAKLSPATVTGSVAFLNGTASLGTAGISGGAAQLTVAAQLPSGAPILAVGTHTIIANYAGDATNGSATAQLTQTVNQQVIQ
jgi:Bacterial Ig-like domain (group 3)